MQIADDRRLQIWRRCVPGARSPAAARRARRSARATSRCAPATSTRRWRRYRKAVQAAPDNPTTRSRLQRAMQAASRAHLEKAHEFEQQDQLEAALGEYRLASEYDPSNRLASSKVAELDRTIRERIEASRPRPAIEAAARARARRVRRTDSQPGVARAAEPPLQQRQPARHPQRRSAAAHRHQHQLRPRVRRTARPPSARRRHARAGAQPDHDDEPALVQGAGRALDLRVPGHAAQARAVRRAGDPDVLSVARRRRPSSRRSSARSSACRASPCSRRLPATRPPIRITVRGTSSVVADSREDHRAERQASSDQPVTQKVRAMQNAVTAHGKCTSA